MRPTSFSLVTLHPRSKAGLRLFRNSAVACRGPEAELAWIRLLLALASALFTELWIKGNAWTS